jgi:predicted nucleic acid-binding Zn ribbon protein
MSRRSDRKRWRQLAGRVRHASVANRFGQFAFIFGLSFFIMAQSLRKRVIEEWRGLPESEERPDRTLSVREVLVQLAPKLGLESRLREEEIISVWTEIVGEFFARHSRPAKLHQGLLVVNVLQPTVLYELDRQWKSLILSKLKKRFGGKLIKELRFRVG